MCGFAGYVDDNRKLGEKSLITRMCDTIAYRGPDDFGIHLGEGVALGHRRLSIIDLTPAGHQPMANEDGSLWLVYNGEIYNFLELAAVLRKKGHLFRSKTDTEVILHLYEEEGPNCLKSLNGMFALAIWDEKNRLLFAARDRLGIKPFFYCHVGNTFLFASEIKAILEHESVRRQPDPRAIADYFFCGMPLSGKTMFKGIHELEPGYFLTYKDGKLETTKYWDMVFDYNTETSEGALVVDLASLLEDAVKIHCRSDAPLGCHLSGGVDSSTVTCLASRYREALKTFSIRFDGGRYFDETPFAKTVARQIGATYLEASPEAEDLERLFTFLIYHNETPLQNIGAFAYFTVSELASRHVKVSLTGHGGDEVFAGYPAQFQASLGRNDMFDLPRVSSRQTLPFHLSRITRAVNTYGLQGAMKRALRRFHYEPLSFEKQWLTLHCGHLPKKNPWFHPTFVESLGHYSPEDHYLEALRCAPTDILLDKCLYHDIRVYLRGLLQMEDRVSMAVSIESRVPLLDYRIIEFMSTIPPDIKIGNLEPKHLLKRATEAFLPEIVRKRRDKSPFPVPSQAWLSNELSRMVRDTLLSTECRSRGILNVNQKDLLKTNPNEMWTAVNLELWFKVFIDQDTTPCSV